MESIFLFDRIGNWGSEWDSGLPKITHPGYAMLKLELLSSCSVLHPVQSPLGSEFNSESLGSSVHKSKILSSESEKRSSQGWRSSTFCVSDSPKAQMSKLSSWVQRNLLIPCDVCCWYKSGIYKGGLSPGEAQWHHLVTSPVTLPVSQSTKLSQ